MPFPILPSNSASGYFLTKSLRFRKSVSATLSRTPASAGNAQKFTMSCWVKLGSANPAADEITLLNAGNGTQTNNGSDCIQVRSDGTTFQVNCLGKGGTGGNYATFSASLRDFSSWYHIVVALDTTQATQSNRCRVYINGVEQTAYVQNGFTLNYSFTFMNSTSAHLIGQQNEGGGPYYSDVYFAEQNYIDGQQLTASSFGTFNSLTGVWQPAKYTGTYGTNGFYLKYTNVALTSGSNTGLGQDYSGNGNYFNTNNISVTTGTTYDSMNDVPTLTNSTTANYCVLNYLDKYSNVTLSNGNLSATFSAYTGFVRGTFALPSTGKYYWEGTVPTSNVRAEFGIATFSQSLGVDPQSAAGCWLWYSNGTNSYTHNAGVQTAWGSAWTSGDIVGIAFDAGAGTLTYYLNGALQGGGAAATGLTGSYAPMLGFGDNSSTAISINFGQRPFAQTPPTGFVALNTYNLPTSTIVKGNTVMDATTFTANGTTQTVTNTAGFKPDLVWQKIRNTSGGNYVVDSVRGASLVLTTNDTSADSSSPNFVTSFNSNGWSLGTNNYLNGSSVVGWQWQAGQGSSSSNTSGSITSTVSVNASAGFSVVTYTGNSTGATVGHGLGVSPGMIIIKNRASTSNWRVWHKSFASTTQGYLSLNLTNAINTDATIWNNTAPTSSVFSVGNDSSVNTSPNTYVAYCWSQIAGFSQFGSYLGSGNTGASTPNANGPFVYTGFRPKFVLIKRTSAAADWEIFDSVRGPYNANYPWLQPNTSSAEASSEAVDFLSNGFKIRSESGATMYPDGATFIYMAFAENPFKNALAR
jgi:hypothetical protein